MISLQAKDKLKALIIICATMYLNLEFAQRACQSQEWTLNFDNCHKIINFANELEYEE